MRVTQQMHGAHLGTIPDQVAGTRGGADIAARAQCPEGGVVVRGCGTLAIDTRETRARLGFPPLELREGLRRAVEGIEADV
jgi:hypothetical protein